MAVGPGPAHPCSDDSSASSCVRAWRGWPRPRWEMPRRSSPAMRAQITPQDADAVLLLDVLHMIPHRDQEQLIGHSRQPAVAVRA